MAFTGVTNVHGPSPQPTACRPQSCSLTTAKEVTRLKARFKPTTPEKSGVDGGANQVPTYLNISLVEVLTTADSVPIPIMIF